MELWIRSQDKGSLMKVDYLYLDGVSKNIIIGYCQSTFTSPKLGTYKTKERALEVLDEIQKYIADSFKENEISQFLGTTGKSKIVYEMPKE